MDESKRMQQLAGINADILENHSVDELNEMAIKNYEGDRVSANEKAKDIVYSALTTTGYWEESDSEGSGNMTGKEIAAVNKAVRKYVDRFIKQLKLK